MNDQPLDREPKPDRNNPQEPKPPVERPEPDPGRQEIGAPAPKPTSAPYAYRWSYEEQAAYNRKELKKRRGHGAAVYATVMAVAFLLCLCVLTGVLVLNAAGGSGGALTTAEIAETVNPGTVLVYASNSTQYGYGTGFFIRSDGYLLTNYHVIEGAKLISVTLYSGSVQEASVEWYSAADDLAILKIEGSGYPVLRLGNSDTLRVGDVAVAVGNPAGKVCPWSVTQGIISAVNREISVESGSSIIDLTMLQTDAQVNPGNSGGPLCNDRGEVIGIVTRKMTDYEGLGLAIPINGAMELVNAYLTTGTTEHIRSAIARVRPTIGIQALSIRQGEPVNEYYAAQHNGVLVGAVNEGGAAQGILEPGDIILKFGGTAVSDLDSLQKKLYEYRAGDSVELVIDRMGEQLTVTIRLRGAG